MIQWHDLQSVLLWIGWGQLAFVALGLVGGVLSVIGAKEAKAQMAAPAMLMTVLLVPSLGLLWYASTRESWGATLLAVAIGSFPMAMKLEPLFREWVPMRNQFADAAGQFEDKDLAEMAKYIWRGDVETMEKLEARGNQWRSKDSKQELLVYAAAEALQPDHGIEPVLTMLKLGQSPKHAAESAQILRRGANDNSDEAEQLLKIWLEAGADPNAVTELGEPALHLAVKHLRRLQMLLKHGADINIRAQDGYTALMRAAKDHSGWAGALLLLEAGANIHVRGADGSTVRQIVGDQVQELGTPPLALKRLQDILRER